MKLQPLLLRLQCVLQLASDIAAGLQYVHSVGICHADVTPRNILVQRQPHVLPMGCVAKLADFGLSRSIPASQVCVENACRGTPFYIAPEVVRSGALCQQSDIYRCVPARL